MARLSAILRRRCSAIAKSPMARQRSGSSRWRASDLPAARAEEHRQRERSPREDHAGPADLRRERDATGERDQPRDLRDPRRFVERRATHDHRVAVVEAAELGEGDGGGRTEQHADGRRSDRRRQGQSAEYGGERQQVRADQDVALQRLPASEPRRGLALRDREDAKDLRGVRQRAAVATIDEAPAGTEAAAAAIALAPLGGPALLEQLVAVDLRLGHLARRNYPNSVF